MSSLDVPFRRCNGEAGQPGYSMGQHTLKVPMELFALNRRRLCDALRPKVPDGAVVLLQGGDDVPLYCTDVNYGEFKQVSGKAALRLSRLEQLPEQGLEREARRPIIGLCHVAMWVGCLPARAGWRAARGFARLFCLGCLLVLPAPPPPPPSSQPGVWKVAVPGMHRDAHGAHDSLR